MEIILLENINNLGKIGEKVKVKNGYGRNFLLPTGKALRASKENLDFVNKKKDELNKKNNEIRIKFKELAKKIENKTLNFNKESKDNGELYALIKPKEISAAFLDELKIEIKPSQIVLKQDINKIGKFILEVALYSEVTASVNIKVSKQDSV